MDDVSIEKVSSSLIVSNHLGILDPLILASKFDVCFAAKSEMKKWPVVGSVCTSAGTIFVERDRRMATSEFVSAVVDKLDAGVSLLVFPEGTTSSGEFIAPFKTGSFEAISKLQDRPVLPVYIRVVHVDNDSSFDARSTMTWFDENQSILSNFWKIVDTDEAHVHIAVGDPILVGEKNRKALASESYQAMTSLSNRF